MRRTIRRWQGTLAVNSTDFTDYPRKVVAGEIVAGDLIVTACRRFLADLDDERFDFRPEKVQKAINFVSMLKHFTGKSNGQPFKLEPWQVFIVANIVGFYWKNTDNRRFSSSYIEVARKNGKSSLAAALCLYFLVADGEGGAEVLLCANSKDQAKICFDMCRNYASTIDPKGAILRAFRADIFFDATKSRLRVLAADDSKLDGFNCSFGLVDEFHAAKNSRVRDVIKSSMGMRQNPHLCTITTAGFDKSSPCYQLRSVAVEVLKGMKEDDELFVAIFSLDEGDDWQDPSVWVKANPNLDITVTSKYIRGQVQQARNNPAEEVSTVTKNLNRWIDTADVWIPEHYIINATKKVDLAAFGTDALCFVGVDLASTSDLTAVAKMVVQNGLYYFKIDYYAPETALIEKPDKELYRYWKRTGQLHITPGNVTDYDYITNELMQLCHNLTISVIGYDRWNAVQWAIDATEKGLPLQEYSQAIGNFNKPTREMERLILSGRAVIDDNEITRFCFRNVQLKHDHNGNCKPNKGITAKKIDGVIAAIQALGIYLETPHYSNEIYMTNET